MPAQWEPHAATWLSWPRDPETWPRKLESVRRTWVELARCLSAAEHVNVLAGGDEVMKSACEALGDMPNVRLCDIATNDAWIRDYGPVFLSGSKDAPSAAVDFDYDAWGGKYPPYELDREAAAEILARSSVRRFAPGIVLEGGAIDVNGQGSVLATEQCLVAAGRNPGLGREDIERILADFCDAPHVIWLDGGIAGDDTDGHVDQVARFVGPRTVAAAVEPDPADENHAPLQENLARLRAACDEQGRPLEVVTLPMPRPIFNDARERLPASYANFYIANGMVLVPAFDDPADRCAQETLARLFPDRRIQPIRCVDLVVGLGAIHCVTQQEPAR